MTAGELRALTANPEVFACSEIKFGLVRPDGTIEDLEFYGWRATKVEVDKEGKRKSESKPQLILAYSPVGKK